MSRAAIVELLHAGVSNHGIAREVGCDHGDVAGIRAELGLPDARTIKGSASPEDLFWRRTQPADGGHLLWAGHRNSTGVPAIRTGGRMHTAGRIAFRIRWDRDPIGRVRAGCDANGCVHPDHVEDQPMRDQYAAIFRAVSA
ncbi:hypothetical protein [Streptomyces sp. NRRL B-24720]|uniref:hypothetical protein n=1 Tax=Streptomyces sp. NRRL B-24720 TaxID=1476876 RepID=UPI0006917544|nr:hypothetical protein [Streptomyces sp. NRRL B-24720]